MLSVNLVAYLRVRLSRKLAVVACFAPRSLVIAASIVRLIWLYPITPHSSPEFRLWLPAILMQIHVCLSICTACIPYMVPFFKSLEGSLRRRHMVDSAGYYTNERGERQTSSLWFRRHTKSSKNLDSWDSIVVVAPRYERVSQASPYIHTPPAISPLTPPRWISPPSTADTQAPSGPGLLINIPMGNSPLLRTTDVGSPQTASSFALSPSCTSPIPLFPFEYSTAPRRSRRKLGVRGAQIHLPVFRATPVANHHLSVPSGQLGFRFFLNHDHLKAYAGHINAIVGSPQVLSHQSEIYGHRPRVALQDTLPCRVQPISTNKQQVYRAQHKCRSSALRRNLDRRPPP
jgi:hypothetical protein